MILKKNRVTKKILDEVWKSGRSVSSGNLVLRFVKGPGSSPPRISFIVPRAVGGAAQRNILRRRGYVALLPHISHLPPGFVGALVYNPKRESEKSFNHINKLVSEIFKSFLS